MKKSILYSMLTAVVALGSFTSCSDFLDAANKSNLEADPYFKTEEGLEALRIKGYNEFKALVSTSDIYEWGTDLYIGAHGAEPGEFHEYDITPETSDISSYYSNAYSLINYANCCIYYGENNAKITAEAKFMRCYGYYLLMQQFGAVPYVTWYIQDASREYPRTPLSELYPAIIEELESIMNDSNLPSTDKEGNISQQAVKALLARVCLAAGWDLGTTLTSETAGTYTVTSTEYFSKAAQYAVAAINGQSLTMSFEDKWSPFNEGNAEEIFSIQYDRDNYPGDVASGGHSLQNAYGGYLGAQSSTGMKYVSSGFAMSDKALYLWEEGDARWDGTFMNTLYNYIDGSWGTTGYYAYYNASNLSTMNIAEKFYPWYTTEEEAEADLAAHQDQYKRGDCTVNNTIQAYILASNCTKYLFDTTTGAVSSKESNTYEYYSALTNCPNVLKKYDDPNSTQGETKNNDYRNIIVFHLSEMYLVAAEAYLMAGNSASALTYLNAVRERSGATALASLDGTAYENEHVHYSVPYNFGTFTSLDIILEESAREMFGEHCRWMDLRRTRQLVRYNISYNSYISSVSDMSNVQGEVKWYRPIPATEISGNDAMTDADQNPGY